MSCLVAHEEKEGWHRMRIWLKKYTKRFLCQKFFLFLLIALPFFTYLYSYAVHQKSTKVKVGIVLFELLNCSLHLPDIFLIGIY